MKVIKYKLLQGIESGKPITVGITIPFSEANEEIAKTAGYNGEYTIEDVAEPAHLPTQVDIIEAQVTYTAMMTDTLLEV